VGNCVVGALSHLGRARAFALADDLQRARKEYESFLSLWAGADANIPVLTQARQEYRRIKAPADF